MQMNSVFNEFAKSWCRRAIIKNAIQKTRPGVSGERRNEDVVHLKDQLAAVRRLEAFGRLVFVISILEGIPGSRVLDFVGQHTCGRDSRTRLRIAPIKQDSAF
jgi:hypothetical protein